MTKRFISEYSSFGKIFLFHARACILYGPYGAYIIQAILLPKKRPATEMAHFLCDVQKCDTIILPMSTVKLPILTCSICLTRYFPIFNDPKNFGQNT